MKDLRDRVVVVTGAGAGIGRALVHAFHGAGAKLVLADRNAETLAEARAELPADAQATTVQVDVARPEEVDALAQRTLDRFGAVHVLCNNAGVGCNGFLWEQPLEDWDWVFGVNVRGVIHGLRSFVPLLLEHGEDAHVVNTSSMLGLLSAPLSAAYTASKHAVLAISECLRMDLEMAGARLGVSVVCPGPVRTGLADERDRPDTQARRHPSATLAQYMQTMKDTLAGGVAPQQVADAVIDGVLNRRFWIFPSPEYVVGARARIDEIFQPGDAA